MTYYEFKNKYNGKYIPNKNQAECWNLVYNYLEEMWKLGHIIAGCGYVINLLKNPFMSNILKYFDEVPITSMHCGDLVIWTDCSHIAIFDNWNEKERKNYFLSQDSSSYAKQYGTNNRAVGVYSSVATGKSFRAFRRKGSSTIINNIKVGDTVLVNGYGTADSYGGGSKTKVYNNQQAKVVKIANEMYALNLNNNMNGVTGWFKKEDIKNI